MLSEFVLASVEKTLCKLPVENKSVHNEKRAPSGALTYLTDAHPEHSINYPV